MSVELEPGTVFLRKLSWPVVRRCELEVHSRNALFRRLVLNSEVGDRDFASDYLKAVALGVLGRRYGVSLVNPRKSGCACAAAKLGKGIRREPPSTYIKVILDDEFLERKIPRRKANVLHGGNELVRQTTEPYQQSLVDLRNRSILRGAEANPNRPPIELLRAALALSIYLPAGSEPGRFEVGIAEKSKKLLLTTEGVAAFRDHITVLEVKLDLTNVVPDQYLLAIVPRGKPS